MNNLLETANFILHAIRNDTEVVRSRRTVSQLEVDAARQPKLHFPNCGDPTSNAISKKLDIEPNLVFLIFQEMLKDMDEVENTMLTELLAYARLRHKNIDIRYSELLKTVRDQYDYNVSVHNMKLAQLEQARAKYTELVKNRPNVISSWNEIVDILKEKHQNQLPFDEYESSLLMEMNKRSRYVNVENKAAADDIHLYEINWDEVYNFKLEHIRCIVQQVVVKYDKN